MSKHAWIATLRSHLSTLKLGMILPFLMPSDSRLLDVVIVVSEIYYRSVLSFDAVPSDIGGLTIQLHLLKVRREIAAANGFHPLDRRTYRRCYRVRLDRKGIDRFQWCIGPR